jgi:hypothetical protein
LDAEEEALRISDVTGQLDAFSFSDVIMYFDVSEADSRQKVTIQPWREMVRACVRHNDDTASSLSAATTADARGPRNEIQRGSDTFSCSPSSATILSRNLRSGADKRTWNCYLSKPAAQFLRQTATSLGVVQNSFNHVWRITGYEGTGGYADVYIAKTERDLTER